LVIFAFFAIYTQILIQNAKREQEYVPRIFAKYIAYTESYLRRAEKYESLLNELNSNFIRFATRYDFQESLWDYISTQFLPRIPIPVIITDESFTPQIWRNVDIPETASYEEISNEDKARLQYMLSEMNQTPIIEGGQITGYAYYARPISLEQFIRKIDYSVIVTDRRKIPLFWHNVDVPESGKYDEIDTENKGLLSAKIGTMTEIPLSNEADSLGYIYFTAPHSLSQIRYMVILELLIALTLVAFGTYGLFLLRRTEKDTLWIGLAKETAHQFGTPITSLMGWIEYLKSQDCSDDMKMNMDKVIDFMTTDLNHLKNIASRFGKVGSQTCLIAADLHSILTNVVEYFRDRMPHLGSRIDIHLISKIEGVNVMLDVELFKWTLENLIKNCVDAMSNKGGNIIITATRKDKLIYLHIRDEGRGIPRSQWKKVFEPGVTTKTRGWGLGLSLAKRIIEEYHQGHIRVLESAVGEGTTFEIRLHAEHHKKGKS
jgi:signal transduction histidine kinase